MREEVSKRERGRVGSGGEGVMMYAEMNTPGGL